MTRYICGIDPGLSGAIALYTDTAVPDPTDCQVIDMPTHQITVNKGKRRQLDLQSLAQWFDLHGPQIARVVIENVHAMPKQGVSSSFTFGRAFGEIMGLVAANFLPMVLVSPRKWKSHFGLTADKDASRRAASRLLPSFSHLWPLKKHDGRAEAVLLAIYGSKQR